jgi:hypothetical protein
MRREEREREIRERGKEIREREREQQHRYIEVKRDELPTLSQSGTYRGGEAVAFQHQMA